VTVCILAVVATASIIFFTPLRYNAFIEPDAHDVDPLEIHTNITEHPDRYLFVDVRPAADYQKMHATDSINIPIGSLYDTRQELPRSGKRIVLICTGGRLSGVAFFFLQHFGFTNIVRVSGGLENWVSEGLPVVLQEAGVQ
jgi:rhodanese-related sulfurtransferase